MDRGVLLFADHLAICDTYYCPVKVTVRLNYVIRGRNIDLRSKIIRPLNFTKEFYLAFSSQPVCTVRL
jgi:hypothetical protein